MDHLLQCSEYPKDAKVNMQKGKNAPNVGIIFLAGNQLLIDRTPVARAKSMVTSEFMSAVMPHIGRYSRIPRWCPRTPNTMITRVVADSVPDSPEPSHA